MESFVSPEKGFLLPLYAEKAAKRLSRQKQLSWREIGQRSSRRVASEFVDDCAESTDRTESSDSSRDTLDNIQ